MGLGGSRCDRSLSSCDGSRDAEAPDHQMLDRDSGAGAAAPNEAAVAPAESAGAAVPGAVATGAAPTAPAGAGAAAGAPTWPMAGADVEIELTFPACAADGGAAGWATASPLNSKAPTIAPLTRPFRFGSQGPRPGGWSPTSRRFEADFGVSVKVISCFLQTLLKLAIEGRSNIDAAHPFPFQ